MFAIIHGQKASDPTLEKMKPYLHLTTDKALHDKMVDELNADIGEGGNGDLLFAGEIDNVEMTEFWVMTFNK